MANLCLVCFVMLHGLVTRECVPASAGRQGGGGGFIIEIMILCKISSEHYY